MQDNPEALAILETLAGRYNELNKGLGADEQLTIKFAGVTIAELGVRGSLIWLYSPGRAIVFALHYSQANFVLVREPLAEGEKPRPIGFLTEPDAGG